MSSVIQGAIRQEVVCIMHANAMYSQHHKFCQDGNSAWVPFTYYVERGGGKGTNFLAHDASKGGKLSQCRWGWTRDWTKW